MGIPYARLPVPTVNGSTKCGIALQNNFFDAAQPEKPREWPHAAFGFRISATRSTDFMGQHM
jgi:hypothetical protein